MHLAVSLTVDAPLWRKKHRPPTMTFWGKCQGLDGLLNVKNYELENNSTLDPIETKPMRLKMVLVTN